jgi:hypothetical protein
MGAEAMYPWHQGDRRTSHNTLVRPKNISEVFILLWQARQPNSDCKTSRMNTRFGTWLIACLTPGLNVLLFTVFVLGNSVNSGTHRTVARTMNSPIMYVAPNRPHNAARSHPFFFSPRCEPHILLHGMSHYDDPMCCYFLIKANSGRT